MRVAAFGRTKWLYDSITAVAERGHQVVLIGTSPTAREYEVDEKGFERLAEDLGSSFFCDPSINRRRYRRLVRQTGAEVAISVNWPVLIGPAMLDQFPFGIMNAHAGDLPRYRGNATPNWAILAGEEEVVLTIHRMAVELDAGPIFLQRSCPVDSATYIGDIHRFMSDNIPEMFVEVVDGLASGTLTGREQDKDPASSLRCFPRLPQDGEIDWRCGATEISRLVRASAEPFDGAYTFVDRAKLTIWRAHPDRLSHPYLGVPGHVVERSDGEVSVLTGEGVLVLQEVEVHANGRVKAAEVIKSTRTRLGLDWSAEILRL